MIHFDHRAGFAQRLILGDLFHRQDRTARDVVFVEDLHRFKFGLGLRPLLDRVEDLAQARQPRRRRGIVRIGFPFRLADYVADRAPDRRLRDEIDVGVRIGLPAFALEDPAGLAATGIIAGARHSIAEAHALAVLAVFGQRAMLQPLLIAQLDTAEVEDAVLHRSQDALAAPCADALIERRNNAKREMQAGAGIADLRAGHQRRTVAKAGGRGRAAGALRNVLIDLAVLVRARPKAFDRGDDHARIELVNVLPSQAHAVERAWREILNQDVALFHQPIEDFLALAMLGIDRDRTLAAVEHREVQAVGPFDVAQLSARDVADAGPLHLDHVGAHIGQELRACGAGLHMREIENAHAFKRPSHLTPGLAARSRQAIYLVGSPLLDLELDDFL